MRDTDLYGRILGLESPWAVMDWASRRALSWRLSNTLDAEFCVEALKEALDRYGNPDIFNMDQGSQFTSRDFVGVLDGADVEISMDGRGRYLDNIFIERLWRSLKYEAVYLHELADGIDARRTIGGWLGFYDEVRPHSSHDGGTPAQVYVQGLPTPALDQLAAKSVEGRENPSFPRFPQPPATAAAA